MRGEENKEEEEEKTRVTEEERKAGEQGAGVERNNIVGKGQEQKKLKE